MKDFKIALLGRGKTGGKILEAWNGHPPTVFSRENPVTAENLKGHDVIISFLPGDAFESLIPTLVSSEIPVVTGSTGFSWPNGLNDQLQSKGLKWIWASNFSLGMTLVQPMIEILGKAYRLFDQVDYHIHETHHTKKLDAPSGTALKWHEWIGKRGEVTSARLGDVVGEHSLRIETPFERIELAHTALDRKIFAEGALWAANKILTDKNLESGLLKFEDIAQRELL